MGGGLLRARGVVKGRPLSPPPKGQKKTERGKEKSEALSYSDSSEGTALRGSVPRKIFVPWKVAPPPPLPFTALQADALPPRRCDLIKGLPSAPTAIHRGSVPVAFLPGRLTNLIFRRIVDYAEGFVRTRSTIIPVPLEARLRRGYEPRGRSLTRWTRPR